MDVEIKDLEKEDAAFVEAAKAWYDTSPCHLIRAGDWVVLPSGEMRRCAHRDPYGTQLTMSASSGSFFLGDSYVAFSGSLDLPLKRTHELVLREGETLPGRVWFFKGGVSRAHNDISVEIPFRVFDLVEG